MSNTIPEGAIPKLFRQRNKSGVEVGSWYINVKTKPVNLRTQDYMKARERAREAFYNGKRDFQDDRYTERLALPPMRPEPNGKNVVIELPQFTSPPPSASSDWTADVTNAAGAGLKPEVFPPGAQPKPSEPPKPETPDDPLSTFEKIFSNAAGSEGTAIPQDMLEPLAAQGATALVELQIMLQAWLAKRGLKIKMGEVPENHKARVIPETIWKKWLMSIVPPNVPLPPYVVAPIVALMTTTLVQLEGATPLDAPKPPEEPPKS